MAIELKVPEVGESITEVQIAQWRKQVGQRAEKDENLVEIESDKATVELPAPVSGTITQILKQPGQRAQVGEVIGYMAAGAAAEAAPPTPSPMSASQRSVPAAPAKPPETARPAAGEPRIMPAAQRVMAQEGIRPEAVTPTGPGGRVLKEDVERAAENRVIIAGIKTIGADARRNRRGRSVAHKNHRGNH